MGHDYLDGMAEATYSRIWKSVMVATLSQVPELEGVDGVLVCDAMFPTFGVVTNQVCFGQLGNKNLSVPKIMLCRDALYAWIVRFDGVRAY